MSILCREVQYSDFQSADPGPGKQAPLENLLEANALPEIYQILTPGVGPAMCTFHTIFGMDMTCHPLYRWRNRGPGELDKSPGPAQGSVIRCQSI